MRRNGELGWLFHHAMPSKPGYSSSGAKINVRVEEVFPILAVLATSLLVACLFLATERLFRRKLLHWPEHLPLGGAADKRTHCTRATKPFKNVHSDSSYDRSRKRVNVFRRETTLPGRYDVSLSAATPCRLLLRTVLGTHVASMLMCSVLIRAALSLRIWGIIIPNCHKVPMFHVHFRA